jgi:hypothetical protein
MRNMEITYTVIIGGVSSLGLFIKLWYTKEIPKTDKYFWTVLIITLFLIGIVFVYLNDRINSLAH